MFYFKRIGAIAVSAVALLAMGQAPAHALTISNGTLNVGIGANGELFDYDSYIGIQRISDGFDPLAPGSPRDSWGINTSAGSSYADQADYGASNVSTTFTSTANSATAVSNVGGGFTVTQNYFFVAPNVLAIKENIANNSGSSSSVVFQRDVDWDVTPTEFNENSFAPAISAGGPIVDSSGYGFENPDPTVAYSDSFAAGGNQTADLGGGIKINLGTIAPGSSSTFEYLYALNTPGQDADGLDTQLAGLGAIYTVTTQSSENGAYPALGENVAAISAVPLPPGLPLFASALAGLGLMGLRRRKTVA